MDIRAGSGRQRTITSKENENLIENLIKKDKKVHKKDKQKELGDRFRKSCSVKKYVWQDEKDFILDVLINSQNSRDYGFEKKR